MNGAWVIPWDFDDPSVGWTTATAYAAVAGAGMGLSLRIVNTNGVCPTTTCQNQDDAQADCSGPVVNPGDATPIVCAATCSKKGMRKKRGGCIGVIIMG